MKYLIIFLIALIIAEVFKIRKRSLLVLGSLLPDLISKVYLLNYFFKLPDWLTFGTYAFHKFLPGIFAGMLIAYLFRKHLWKAIVLIPMGVVLHLSADYTTIHFFLTKRWYHILWADQYWIALIITGMVYLLVLFIKKKKGGKNEIKKDT